MKTQWLDPPKWREIQELVPIACVDILPLRLLRGDRNTIEALGLIMRETPHQGRRWCLIGGRLCRNESLHDAINREIRDALGNDLRFTIKEDVQPDFVAEYFTVPRDNGGFDPRQHAIGLTFCVPIKGKIRPQGEAISFAWFNCFQLPPPEEFGFDQDRVVAACLGKSIWRLKPPNKRLHRIAQKSGSR